MNKVTVRFTVMTNNNIYWATSLKSAVWFCNQNDMVIDKDLYITASITERNTAEKCGRGIYCILDK
jgi:hypothetical protein